MCRYVHYGHDHFDREKFQEIKNEPYFCKPKGGLWASPVNAEYGWKDWCEAENFKDCTNEESFSFRLKDGAKVYHIRSMQNVKSMPLIETDIMTYYIPDFERMLADGWDAVELHLSECEQLYWALYGWDCDCILIMNKYIIE
jgi:hypothetical protein